MFILPVVLGVLIFSLYPMIMSLYYSFFKIYTGTTDLPQFEVVKGYSNFGLFNYKKLLTMDPEVWQALKVTFTYAIVVVPSCLILSFGIALLLNSKIRGIGIFRVLYYLPVIIPTTIWGLLWRDFFDVRFGLANRILTGLGAPANTFFTSASTALPTFMSMNLWTLGASMILWLSALKNVPSSLIEAAKLDGAGAMKRLWYITLPMCSSVFFYNLVTGIIGTLQMLGPVMTVLGQSDGGPDNSLLFFAYKIYGTAFKSYQMGYACALAWFLFLIVAFLTLLIFKTSKWVYYADDGGR
jgi:multiple sugar transport system permease protein